MHAIARPQAGIAAALVIALSLMAGVGHAGPPRPAEPDWTGASVEHYAWGRLDAPTPGAVSAGYALMGGGNWPVEAMRWFVQRAGGGHIVILRARGAAELQDDIVAVGGMQSVETLVIHDAEASRDPRVLATIRHADGIFIGGGDQSNYVRAWKGTPINRLLDEHVAAGKPIGGTSAGLAILGAYAYGCLDSVSMTAQRALHDPTDGGVTLVRNFLHLPYLQHVITDTHFAKRGRQGRLVSFVARLIQEDDDLTVTGLGIDEDTALLVDAAGIARFYRRDGGYAWMIRPLRKPATIVAGQPLTYTHVPVVGIGPGSTLDLKTFAVKDPAFVGDAEVRRGVLALHGTPDIPVVVPDDD